MRKNTVPPRPKDMMESLTPEQRQAIFQKAKQVEKSAQQIQQEKQLQTKRRNQALASSMMFNPDADAIVPGISDKQVKTLSQEKQEQATQQKKLVKRTAQGTVKKAITTEYGTFDYEASPEESKILELGGQEANDLLVKIANYYRDEFKKQNVPIKKSRKGFADLWEAGLNPESVDVQGQLRTNLKETFAPYTPLLPRLALEKMAGALGSKGQELLQSENMAAKGAGLVTSIGASIAEDLSNPLATFAYDTGNLYDPTATAEERGGAAFNVVTKYALPAIAPLGAAQAGIKAFKAGQTVEQALTTASRALLRSSLGALGKKIDTAVYSKVPLNKLLDVLEAEGQMMGKTRAALSKELADAGKTFAKETGKGVDEFYTRYLNDYAEGKAQLTSPGRVPPPIIEPVKAPEIPTQVEPEIITTPTTTIPEPTAPVVQPPVKEVFDWSNPANEQAVRDALYAYRKQQYPNASEKILQKNVDSRIANLKDNPDINPFARFSENDQWIDIRNNQATSSLWAYAQPMPTSIASTWDTPGVADEARTALTNYLKQRWANKNYSDEYLQNLVDKAIAERAKGADDNPFFIEIINKKTGTTQIIDPRTGQPTKKLLSELQTPTQAEDLGAVVDDLVAKTEPVIKEPAAPVVETPVTPPTSIVDEIEQGMGASKSTAPPPPTEPTVTGIPEIPDKQLTSAKNRMTQEVRDEYNMSEFDEPTRRAWEESLTTAKQELQSNANAVDNVIAKIDSKRAINEAEQSVLVVALSRERRNARALLEQTNNATSPEEIATLAQQTKIAEDRIDSYTNALNRAGSETARTLNARRAIIDAAEDLVSIRAKARQTYGKTLEVADEEAINEIGKGLEDINKQIDDATGKGTTPVETVKANTRVKGIKESAPKLQPKADAKRVKQFESVVNRVKEKLDAFVRPSTIETMGVPTEVDIWQPRLNDPASQAYFKQLASVQNDMGKVIQKLVTDELIEDFNTLLARLQADGFNITDTDLKLILSADYPTTKLYDFSDIETEYVKMVRRQLAQEAKGSSVAERGRLIKKIQDLSQKVQAGIRKTTDKTVKTIFEENIDLQNRLDDLQAQRGVQEEIYELEKLIANPVLKEKLEREIPKNVQQLLIQRELLRRRKQQIMRKLAAEKDKRDNPSKYAMMNAFKLVNELKFGADASSLFTHGLFNAGTKESALAFKDGISAMFSEKKLSQILSEIKTNPRYQEAIDAGVAGLKERELADSVVYSNVVENVPILKSLYTPGSRFNEAFNTRLRMTMYNDAANLMESRWFGAKGTKDAPTRQAIATTVNNMTGAMTGKLAKSLNQNEAAREFIGVVFPTIKFLGSRFQLAFGNPALQAAMAKNPALAVYVAKKYARFGALMIGGLYGLDKVLPKDRFKIDNDPKDIKNFGKITDLQTNIVYQPFKNFLDPYKVTLGMEVMRDFMADKDENGIPIESSKPEQSFFERDETSILANRIGTAPRAAYNLLAGIASPTYKSFGKNLSIRTSEGRINTATQFAPIAGIQMGELATLKEPATQRDVDLANKLIGIVIAPSGIPISVKKDKESKARQPVTLGVIP